jgi:hypothetical protein
MRSKHHADEEDYLGPTTCSTQPTTCTRHRAAGDKPQLVLSTERGASIGTTVQTDVHREGTHLGLCLTELLDLQHETQPSAEWAEKANLQCVARHVRLRATRACPPSLRAAHHYMHECTLHCRWLQQLVRDVLYSVLCGMRYCNSRQRTRTPQGERPGSAGIAQLHAGALGGTNGACRDT